MIVVVGLGMLGSRVCKLLPAHIPLLVIDFDTVQRKNIGLQYPAQALGMKKVDAAKLYAPHAQTVHKHIDVTTVGLLQEASLVIDCTDNLVSRYVINDFCSREGIPWIHTAMNDTVGTVAVFLPEGPCFSCVYPHGKGETCTSAANTTIADSVASVAVHECLRLIKKPDGSHFIRITKNGKTAMAMTKNPRCETCNGVYTHLELKPRSFYITYCTNSKCMAAKPLKHSHDHGVATTREVDGIPLSIYPNGEIHFHKEADADILYTIAEKVYKK